MMSITKGMNNNYPLLAFRFLLLQFLNSLRPSSFKRFEFLLLEGPIVGNTRVLLNLLLPTQAKLLRLLRFLPVVLPHLPYDLVLLLQRNPLALTLWKTISKQKTNIIIQRWWWRVQWWWNRKRGKRVFLLLLFFTIVSSQLLCFSSCYKGVKDRGWRDGEEKSVADGCLWGGGKEFRVLSF